MRNVLVKVLEKIKKYILCSIIYSPENRAFYDVMWKNIVERERSQMTIWRMRIARLFPKAINTHSEYVILIAVPLQQWLHESSSMVRYTYISRLFKVR